MILPRLMHWFRKQRHCRKDKTLHETAPIARQTLDWLVRKKHREVHRDLIEDETDTDEIA